MSGTSRRSLLKGALAGGMSLVGAQAALGLPEAEVQEEESRLETGALSGAAVSGAPSGPTTSIQYNAGAGHFGGVACAVAGLLRL